MDVLSADPLAAASTSADPLAPDAATLPTDAKQVIVPPSQPSNPDALLTVEVDTVEAGINMELIPAATRTDLLRSAVQSYVTNRVSTTKSVLKKKNEAFDIYDAAVKNDPLQTLVAKPEGEREQLDVVAIITSGIQALYDGKFGRRVGDGTKKSKPQRDPLITQITRAVVQEVFQKGKAADKGYKYPSAAKEVGNDGLAYLRGKIDALVAAGGDAKQLNDFLETRYIKPAKVMLGIDVAAPRFKDVAGIL